MEKTTPKTQNLPPLNVLFSDSWEMFKGSLLNLLILTVIAIVVYVGLFVVGLLLALPLGAISIFSAIQSQELSPAFFSSLGGLGIVLGVFMIAAVIISFAFQAATLLIVSGYKEKPHAGNMLKRGFSFVLPLFLASIVMGFIVTGGYFLFIIPGILFYVALYFVMYEIVLNKRGVLSACRRSIGIVFANFWGLLGRVLLLTLIVFGISFIPGMVIGASGSDTLQALWSIFSSVISVLVSWYSISYGVTLYNQAEKAAPDNKTGKLLWPVLTAIVGWILGIVMIAGMLWFIFSFIIPQIQNAARGQQMQNFEWSEDATTGEEFNPEMLLDLLPTDSPERAELQQELERLEKENGTMMDQDSMMRYEPKSN